MSNIQQNKKVYNAITEIPIFYIFCATYFVMICIFFTINIDEIIDDEMTVIEKIDYVFRHVLGIFLLCISCCFMVIVICITIPFILKKIFNYKKLLMCKIHNSNNARHYNKDYDAHENRNNNKKNKQQQYEEEQQKIIQQEKDDYNKLI
jgi:hypothetical protein